MRYVRNPHRAGFTLVEVLVAAALCILIMTLLTYAFQQGMDTFSILKSTGELQERERAAAAVLREDLQAIHIETEGGPIKVSDLRLDQASNASELTKPPFKGFFRIMQESAIDGTVGNSILATASPYQYEGDDNDGLLSSRATNHVLHMTVKRDGTRADRMFVAGVPTAMWTNGTPLGAGVTTIGQEMRRNALLNMIPAGGTLLASDWAEVAYFLESSGATTANGLPMFTLYRRVRVLPRDLRHSIDWNAVTGGQLNAYQGISFAPTTRVLNDPTRVTTPNNRLGGLLGTRGTTVDTLGALRDASSQLIGEDIVMTNVLSFEIKASWDGNPAMSAAGDEYPFDDIPVIPSTTGPQTPNGIGNPNFQRQNDPANSRPRVFDTWSRNVNWQSPVVLASPGPPQVFNPNPEAIPLRIRLKAVQIKLRVYDTKNQIARQMTLIQGL